MVTVKQMHIMRIEAEEARRQLKKNKPTSPLARDIERKREEITRGLLGQSYNLINKQLEVASLPVVQEGKDNDTVLKATNSLLDRVFGKAKESIDLNANVQFSLKALAQERLKVNASDVTPLEDMVN